MWPGWLASSWLDGAQNYSAIWLLANMASERTVCSEPGCGQASWHAPEYITRAAFMYPSPFPTLLQENVEVIEGEMRVLDAAMVGRS